VTGDSGLHVVCPAKINLSLRVLGVRKDGYHEIRTVFQAIDLYDRLEVEPAGRLEIVCDRPEVPDGRENLVLRMASEFRRTLGERRGALFRLRKRIPVGGGLGGGSADAAAALVLLERLWHAKLSASERDALGRAVGSDVNFFFHGGTARGFGRGDRVVSLDFVGARPLVLGVPPFGIDTEEVYRRFRARLTPSAKGVSVPRLSGRSDREVGLAEVGTNDLEPVVFETWPVLEQVRDDLRELGASVALLSGSGATVFGVFDSADERDLALTRLSSRYGDWWFLRARTVPHGIR
jgi:4-diphosphocytidyl-2-C-methyl-D-erythritol kinase